MISVWQETHSDCGHWVAIFEPTATNIVWPKYFLVKEVRSYHLDGMVYVRFQAPLWWRADDVLIVLRSAGIDRELHVRLETAYPWIMHTGVYESVVEQLKTLEAVRQLREAAALQR